MNDDIEDEFPDPVVLNPPSEIFLNVGILEEDCDFSQLDEICWCTHSVFSHDPRYLHFTEEELRVLDENLRLALSMPPRLPEAEERVLCNLLRRFRGQEPAGA